MVLLESVLPLIGMALCILAALPLALWSCQSLLSIQQDRRLFRSAQELLRQQILNATSQPAVAPNLAATFHDADVMNRTNSATAAVPAYAPSKADQSPSSPVTANGMWNGYRAFRVARLVKETDVCTSVYLQPEDGLQIADFRPGQHLPLKFTIPGQPQPVVRCYSLSDRPGKDSYRISVKQVPGFRGNASGVVSSYVNQQLAVGDRIESRPPAGHFVLDTNSRLPVVMLAGGIGITPMISMIEELRHNYPQRLVVLAYGVRNKADQAFGQYLRDVAATHEQIHVVNCFSAPDADAVVGVDYHLRGFVTVDLIKQLFQDPQCQFYLCGPPPFMESLYQGLIDWPIPESQIFFEAFGPASIGSRKQTASSQKPTTVGGEVTFAATGSKVAWSDDYESLLDLAEASGVPMNSGCRAGSCGTCATDLISGSVSYPDVHDVNCEPGQCLTCIARPVGSIELGA